MCSDENWYQFKGLHSNMSCTPIFVLGQKSQARNLQSVKEQVKLTRQLILLKYQHEHKFTKILSKFKCNFNKVNHSSSTILTEDKDMYKIYWSATPCNWGSF